MQKECDVSIIQRFFSSQDILSIFPYATSVIVGDLSFNETNTDRMPYKGQRRPIVKRLFMH